MIMGLFKNKQELLFYIFFFLITLAQSFGVGAASNPIIISITILSFIPFLLKLFSTKYTKREFLIIIVLIIYAIISAIVSKNILFLINISIVLSLKNINIKKLIRLLFVYRLVGFLLVIILCKLGVFPNRELYLFEGNINTYIVRQSLGFYHPNLLGLYSFVLITMFLYGFFHKLKIYHFIIMIVVTLFIYFICYSRTALICSLLVIVLSFLVKYVKKLGNFFLNELTITFPLTIILLFVLLSIFYNTDSEICNKINSIFSGRLFLSYSYFKESGISLFGSLVDNISYIGGKIVVVDSGYLFLLFNFGLIGFLVTIVSIFLCNYYFLKNNMKLEFVIFAVFLFYCLTEKTMLLLLLNFPMLYLSNVIFRKEDKSL